MQKQLRPGPGWKHVNGPVWDHVNGTRLHLHGLVRKPDGTIVDGTLWPESKNVDLDIRITGNRKRGLMIWAMRASN